MKRTFWIVLLSNSLLAALLTWGGSRLNHEASAQGKDHDGGPARGRNAEVVVIVCETDIVSTPSVITVLASSSSEGAPTVSVGSECAQALASVLDAGFRLRDATSILGLRVQYTLINR